MISFAVLKQTFFAAVLAKPLLAVIVPQFEDLPRTDYDFIIVGGGTAGLVVANRLTEDPRYSVLVIEAGGTNVGVFNSEVPFFDSNLYNTPADWNYTTTPMTSLGGRSLGYTQGHILGGCSSIDGLVYTRGSSDDYDRYANLTKDSGWSWSNIQPYLRKNERWTAPVDHHSIKGEFDPSVHSFHGMNAVSLPGFVYSFDRRVIQATSELPEFPFNLDMNSGNTIGIGWTQSTIGAGVRSSSATSYLAQEFARRPNLHVLIHSRVTRILKTGTSGGLPVFKGVEFAEDGNPGVRPLQRVTAKKEVILSGGAIGTPHILQNSGIGDSAHLSKVGVKPLVHLPSVGRNLTDHPFVANTWLVNSTDTFDTALRNVTLAEEQTRQWNKTHTGPYADGSFNTAGWLRLPDNSTIFEKIEDPSAGPHSAHYEFLIANGKTSLPIPPTGNFMVINAVVASPVSRGSVLINSSDPFNYPIINPNLFDSPFDLFTLREAIRASRRFAQAPVFSDYVISVVDTAVTDDELDAFIRDKAATFTHMVGTSSMSAKGASYGVVDPDLRVKKVVGLRVIDSSVLPFIPAAHTQATTYVVAERASDLIKAAW